MDITNHDATPDEPVRNGHMGAHESTFGAMDDEEVTSTAPSFYGGRQSVLKKNVRSWNKAGVGNNGLTRDMFNF